MNIKIIKGKSSKYNALLEEITKKLYPSADVESKLNFKVSELKNSIAIDGNEFKGKTPKEIAVRLIEATSVGVSERVLESL